MAPTKVIRRTKRVFRREERLFRREIIRTIAKEERENKCAVCKRRGKRRLYWINVKKQHSIILSEVITLEWKTECWRCGRETPVVWRAKIIGNLKEGYGIEDYEEFYQDVQPYNSFLIKASKIFPFVRRVYSRTLGKFVYGNCCIHCGAYQGNYYVSEEFLFVLQYKEWEKTWRKPERKRLTLKEVVDDFGERKLKEFKDGVKLHTHHISYNPEITIKVCPACHNRIHHTDKYPHLKPLDRRPDSKKKQKGGEVV